MNCGRLAEVRGHSAFVLRLLESYDVQVVSFTGLDTQFYLVKQHVSAVRPSSCTSSHMIQRK